MWYCEGKLNRKTAHFLFLSVAQEPRSDEGLMLKTLAFQVFHRGYSAFMNSFDKTNFLYAQIMFFFPKYANFIFKLCSFEN